MLRIQIRGTVFVGMDVFLPVDPLRVFLGKREKRLRQSFARVLRLAP